MNKTTYSSLISHNRHSSACTLPLLIVGCHSDDRCRSYLGVTLFVRRPPSPRGMPPLPGMSRSPGLRFASWPQLNIILGKESK